MTVHCRFQITLCLRKLSRVVVSPVFGGGPPWCHTNNANTWKTSLWLLSVWDTVVYIYSIICIFILHFHITAPSVNWIALKHGSKSIWSVWPWIATYTTLIYVKTWTLKGGYRYVMQRSTGTYNFINIWALWSASQNGLYTRCMALFVMNTNKDSIKNSDFQKVHILLYIRKKHGNFL